jgi:hypothetical protein
MIHRSVLRTANLAASIAPAIPATSTAETSAISPKLASLIAEFERSTAELDGTPEITLVWDQVSNSRLRALNELLDYRPASLGELADKLEALKPFIREDEDLVSVDVLIDDVRALIGEAGR